MGQGLAPDIRPAQHRSPRGSHYGPLDVSSTGSPRPAQRRQLVAHGLSLGAGRPGRLTRGRPARCAGPCLEGGPCRRSGPAARRRRCDQQPAGRVVGGAGGVACATTGSTPAASSGSRQPTERWSAGRILPVRSSPTVTILRRRWPRSTRCWAAARAPPASSAMTKQTDSSQPHRRPHRRRWCGERVRIRGCVGCPTARRGDGGDTQRGNRGTGGR